MFRFRGVFVAAIAVGLSPSAALAQPPGGVSPSRPVYSPYLNLVRRDAPAGINYYGLVRPQIAAQNNIQALQQQITTGQQRQSAGQSNEMSALPTTGQQTFFLNTGGYFLNTGASGASVNPSLTTRSPTSRPPARTR